MEITYTFLLLDFIQELMILAISSKLRILYKIFIELAFYQLLNLMRCIFKAKIRVKLKNCDFRWKILREIIIRNNWFDNSKKNTHQIRNKIYIHFQVRTLMNHFQNHKLRFLNHNFLWTFDYFNLQSIFAKSTCRKLELQ